MIKNEDTYCTVQHKIVRELGAMEAVIYGTIVNLLRKTDGIGEVSNQTLMELCGINNKMGLYRYIKKLIETGYIEKRAGDGRGNISIYYVTKKGNNMLPFNDKKGNKNDTERVTKMNEKGNNMLPLNKEINKEINKENSLSSFDGSKAAKDEEDKILIEEKNNITQEIEQDAIESVKNLFAKSTDKIEPDIKASFKEFWRLFNPDESQKCKYKVALQEWNGMTEKFRAAAIRYLSSRRPNNSNPYFWLQHFAPVFLNEREQYNAYKQNVQLCRVRYLNDKQFVCSAWMADLFQLTIIDDHYEKKFNT